MLVNCWWSWFYAKCLTLEMFLTVRKPPWFLFIWKLKGQNVPVVFPGMSTVTTWPICKKKQTNKKTKNKKVVIRLTWAKTNQLRSDCWPDMSPANATLGLWLTQHANHFCDTLKDGLLDVVDGPYSGRKQCVAALPFQIHLLRTLYL